MAGVRICCVLLLLISAAACAGAPQRHAETLTAPPPFNAVPQAAERGNAHYANQSLEICPGMHVSNAPAADAHRRLVGFQPYSRVQGVTLARAPVSACVSSGFGPRRGNYHNGVDLYTRNPEPVYAGGDGIVEYIGLMNGYGQTVVIRHTKDLKTRYAHLSSYAQGLRVGGRVREGELIGRTGATGNATAVHLHYEVLVNGAAQNPLTIGG